MDRNSALVVLGGELYKACCGTGKGDQQQTIGDLLDTRVAAKGSHPSSILKTMLWLAAQYDNADVVDFCIGRGAIVGEFAMISVARCQSFASHQVMIRAKAVDINYCTDRAGDMLSNAVTFNHLDWARFCLEEGSDPNWSYVENYKTVIAAAAEEGFQDMVELLLRLGAELRGSGAIVLAAEAGQIKMVRFLLARGADVNEVGVEHYEDTSKHNVGTPLHRA